MLLSRRSFPPFMIGLLLFAGVAQAQNAPSGTNPQSSEMKADGRNYLQPWQPCLNADQGQEGVKGSLQEERPQSPKTVNVPLMNQPNSQDKTKKVAGAEKTGPKSDLLKPSYGKNRGSITQNIGPHVVAVGSSPTGRGSMHSPASGASFLDGYLLKSLQDKGMGRRKVTKERESKDDLPQKKAKKTY